MYCFRLLVLLLENKGKHISVIVFFFYWFTTFFDRQDIGKDLGFDVLQSFHLGSPVFFPVRRGLVADYYQFKLYFTGVDHFSICFLDWSFKK